MDSYKKRALYSWLVPLLGVISLIGLVVWYVLIGHESFFGIFPAPAKPSFGNDVLYGGLALVYLIPVFLFASWFGDGIIDAIKSIFNKKRNNKKPSNFELLETGWHKAIVCTVLVVGIYAIPALALVYFVLSICCFGFTISSDSNSSNDNGYNSYPDSKEAVVQNKLNTELEEAYQYTSGILREKKYKDIKFSYSQKRDLKEAVVDLYHDSDEYQVLKAVDTIKRVAREIGVDKDPYSMDRGEIYISPCSGSENKNKEELIHGIKKDIKKIVGE